MSAEKKSILVYSFHTPESSGGLMWGIIGSESEAKVREEFAVDKASNAYAAMRLVSFKIDASLTSDQITNFLDDELIFQLELGLIGHNVEPSVDNVWTLRCPIDGFGIERNMDNGLFTCSNCRESLEYRELVDRATEDTQTEYLEKTYPDGYDRPIPTLKVLV